MRATLKLKIECSRYNVMAEEWWPVSIKEAIEVLLNGNCRLRVIIERGAA